jgi:nitroimidazol reductase NimA-like FMN-containing flavoprotein (pyridoxamine 5'-phosphate oxidase superfamily)
MFREMRRKDKAIPVEIAKQVLRECEEGFFSTISVDNGYPHTVAVNHYYDGENIYFHCAKTGHKIDNILANDKVSFICAKDIEVIKSKYSTKFKSVIVYGKAEIVSDKEVKKEILYQLSKRFVGKFIANFAKEIAGALDVTSVVKIKIEHISGKEAK